MRRAELVRKAVHIPGGLLPAVAILLLGWTAAAAIAVFLLAYVAVAWDDAQRRVRLPIVAALAGRTERAAESSLLAALEFMASLVVVGLLFPLPYFLGAMALLGAGDGAAAIAGLTWGRRGLPWNPNKTWAGLAGGMVIGVPAAVGFAIVGGVLQARGFDEGSSLTGASPTWPTLVGLVVGFVVLHAAARWIVKRRPGLRVANATPTHVVGAFLVALAPAVAFLVTAPLWLDGPALPTQGGHGSGTIAALALVPVLVMFVESTLRRHDNLALAPLYATLSYAVVFLESQVA